MNFGDLQSCCAADFSAFPQNFHGVAVACSGGVDSTVLFRVICEFAKEKNIFHITLLHVNFGLRGNSSDEDERFCEAMAKAAGVAFHCLRISPQTLENRSGEGVQEWARRLRYEEFAKFIEKGWIVATAHHLDDVAENVLLRAARGSSPGTVAGMRRLQNGIWRPFLEVPKARLQQFAAAKHLHHRHDASNDKLEYSRNVIRLKVIPELDSISPGCAQRIAKLGLECQELTDAVRREALEVLPVEDLSENDLRRFRTWVLSARTLSPQALREWVAGFVREVAGHRQIGLSRDFFEELLIVLKEPPKVKSWARTIPGGVRVRVSHGFLYIETAPAAQRH